MIRAVSIFGLVFALALYIWSNVVNDECGYDCGIIPIGLGGMGPAAVVGGFLAVFIFALSLVGLLVAYHRRRAAKRSSDSGQT